MSRWLAFPLQALFLLTLWLLLNLPFAWVDLIAGIGIAIAGSVVLRILEPPESHARRPWAVLKLLALVSHDVTRSNFAVARIILSRRKRDMTSGFMDIPLEMRTPYGLAILAVIITATPGTLWISFSSSSGLLTIHMLDRVGEDAWIETIKLRYERLLMEVFE